MVGCELKSLFVGGYRKLERRQPWSGELPLDIYEKGHAKLGCTVGIPGEVGGGPQIHSEWVLDDGPQTAYLRTGFLRKQALSQQGH